MVKLLWFDRQGMHLYSKHFEKGTSSGRSPVRGVFAVAGAAADGAEGIDSRMPRR
jgi:hypothetical protein